MARISRLGRSGMLERSGLLRPAAELPGVDLPGVATVEDVLTGAIVAGRRCLVIDGTGRVQAGLAADLLAREGREVTVVTPYHTVCDNTEGSTKEPLYERLYRGGVTMTPDTTPAAIEANGGGRLRVRGLNEYSGRTWAIDGVDTVVLAYGGRAVDGLYRALENRVPERHLVGDAMAPRLLHDALLEGTRAGRRV